MFRNLKQITQRARQTQKRTLAKLGRNFKPGINIKYFTNLLLFQISLGFTFPFLAGQYCYQRALALTEAAVVNILVFVHIFLLFCKDQVISQLYLIFCGLLSFQSASSSVFTLLLSGVFPSEPSDRITVSKVFAVLFNFCGVVLVR